MFDAVDRKIVNTLQGGFPLTQRPFAEVAEALGLHESDLIARVAKLLDAGRVTRFGPMFNVDRMGGAFCLCAIAVPRDRFDEVASIVNAHPEVAHNYERTHALNMWFVLASERADDIDDLVAAIAAETGLEVFAFPKLEEFFIGLRVDA